MAYYGYNPLIDSPTFTKTPAITAGSTLYFDFLFKNTTTEPASKYVPLNYIWVQNNSLSPIILTVKDTTYYVGTSSAMQLTESDIGAYTSFSIKNNGTSNISAGELLVTVQRRGISGTRDIVQNIIQKLIG